MRTETPSHATIASLRRLIGLAGSSDLFLTAYVSTSRQEVTNSGLRAHVSGLLDQIAEEVEQTPWRDQWREERRHVEELAESIRPGTDALLLISSPGRDGILMGLWLPGRVADEVRFGPGAYVLPLVNILDEWEPMVLAFVEKDQAKLIVAGAARIEEVREYSEQVPSRHQDRSTAERQHERHTTVVVGRHLNRVESDLEEILREHGIRRVFLSGPVEPLSQFKGSLPQRVRDRVAGEIPIDAHASPDDAIERALPVAREAERREEQALVEELVTRAEKDAQAVTGADETLAAVNRHEVYRLLLSDDTNLDGRYCIGSGVLFGPRGTDEAQCEGPVRHVWLRQELPSYTIRRGVDLEVVHGDAARLLNRYGGIGGFIRSPRR